MAEITTVSARTININGTFHSILVRGRGGDLVK